MRKIVRICFSLFQGPQRENIAFAAALNILRFLSDFPKLFRELVSSELRWAEERGVNKSDWDLSNERSELTIVSLMIEKEETETDSLSNEALPS